MSEPIWTKLGMVYKANNNHPNLLTHASNPLADFLEGDIYRIYYSGRDDNNRSSVSYVDYDVVKNKIINDYKQPIVTPKENTFYGAGITIGNMWEESGNKYIGFMGWQQLAGEHWRGDIGKINLRTGDVSLVLGVNPEDKISLSYPHVIKDENIYKMWYGSTISWSSSNGEMVHVINYATSEDGNSWETQGLAIPYEIGIAQAFSKPCVVKTKKGYHMWFSYRSGTGTPYRLGYASSSDGVSWNREQSNLTVSSDGWDKEMVCYPYVFRHKNFWYMLYNGNRYGQNGFGLAKGKLNK